MPNMGMINSNSMMNYTYLNSNYQNYPQQQGYNTYIPNQSNKFSSNQLYSPQNQNLNQIYSNVYQNNISNQMPINATGHAIQTNTTPLINNIVPNPNLSANSSPGISTLSNTSVPIQKELNLSNVQTSSATSHIKKPINLEAQSFIPKNLKKQSISSEKDLQRQIPKKEAVDTINGPFPETPEEEIKSRDKTEVITKHEFLISDTELLSTSSDLQQKTPKSIKNEADKIENTRIVATESTESPDNFSLDKKDIVFPKEEKPANQANVILIPEANKHKPKTLLGSILNKAQESIEECKPAEKIIFNQIPVPAKNKQNDLSKAFDEKARILKEQEKLKKEEKLKEEIRQNQLSKKTEKKQDREEEKREEKKEKQRELINLEEKSTEKKIKIDRIYFKINEDQKAENIKNRYAYDYLFAYRNWKICYETKLVENLMTGHFKDLKETLEEISTNRQQGRGAAIETKSGFGKRGTKFRDEPIQPKIANENVSFKRSKIEFKQQEVKDSPSTEPSEGLGKWGRKDLSKEENLASEFKAKREEQFKKDPIRFKLTEYNYIY